MNDQEVTSVTPKNCGSNASSKSSLFELVISIILTILIVKLFGLIGGISFYLSYFWLKSRINKWFAVVLACITGVVVGLVGSALLISML